MKKQFRQLRYGTLFHYPDAEDALNDGYECRMQKIGRNLAVDLRHGLRETVSGDAEVIVDDFIKVHPSQVTEVERVALTLLANANPDHPCLYAWAKALVDDPNEFRSLDDYILDENPESLGDFNLNTDALERNGFARPARFTMHGPECLSFKILDYKGTEDWSKRYGPPAAHEQKMVRWMDHAILILAQNIADYRQRGRPEGDQAHTIMGMGAPLLRVTTSLAASIVEYHESYVNAIYSTQLRP